MLDEFGCVWTFGVDSDGRCGQPVAAKPKRTNKMQTAGDLMAVHFPYKVAQLSDVASGEKERFVVCCSCLEV